MIDSLDIGKYIHSKLIAIGGFKVYPCIADNDAKLPFVIYKRIQLSSNNCKDGYYVDNAIIEVTIVADKYNTSVDIAKKVRYALESMSDVYNDTDISNVYLYSSSESFDNNSFVQNLQFSITINKC